MDTCKKIKKNVITYGTFDLFHHGHINLLKRAKELGDYLIVGVTTDSYDRNRGKLNVKESLMQRIENVKRTGCVDEIIIEEYEGQKIDDIQKYDIDIFAIGSDWTGKFDYLNEYCKVIYLERTKGISSTELRDIQNRTIRLGVIGSGRIASRFILESKYVSGVEVVGVYNPKIESAKEFAKINELEFFSDELESFTFQVDAVYIASPHLSHGEYILKALQAGKHVLCEKPIVLQTEELKTLYSLAQIKNLVLMEGIKTAYCPGFLHLISFVKSGVIGEVKDIETAFTKLSSGYIRELDPQQAGGSMTELSSYVLLPIIKILGANYENIQFVSQIKNGVDMYTKGHILYKNATASFKVGLGVKTEGDLVITGTKGYIYVPAPWWKTEYFELRYEDLNDTRKFFYKFDGDGLRYEIDEFMQQIVDNSKCSYKLSIEDSLDILSVIERYREGRGIVRIS